MLIVRVALQISLLLTAIANVLYRYNICKTEIIILVDTGYYI